MPENVRLIIWDLDETFWDGTLTEGGISIRIETCDLVKNLARRGIISSICSKNNFGDVKQILEDAGVWDYFVFPSINWEAKAPRIASIVEAAQLRPSTVMFVDDNQSNLEEVRHYIPEIQVQNHHFISSIFDSPLFAGKDDSALSRLNQYKLLETRKQEEQAAGPDVSKFLRASNIRVQFEYDIETNIDRVVELINRTNQLNFTKQRLSEDVDVARAEALGLLRRYNIQAGLIRVQDRYGDHGFCGFYAVNNLSGALVHYCFSCRILGMGVEQWLYNVLGRPVLNVKGDVLSDPTKSSIGVDWINQLQDENCGGAEVKLVVDRVIARGGCDLSAAAHYFGVHGIEVAQEFNSVRNGLEIRSDHSIFLHYALKGMSSPEKAIAKRLQYSETDFTSALFDDDRRLSCVLLSFSTDAHYALYKHRLTGLVLPCPLGLGPVSADQRSYEISPEQQGSRRAQLQQVLKEEFDFCGLTTEIDFKEHIQQALRALGTSVPIFIICPSDHHLDKKSGAKHSAQSFVRLNEWTNSIAADFTNVSILNIADYVKDQSEVEDILHYDRKVYYRIYEDIRDRLVRGDKPIQAT
jgi:FkbH-like protein